MLNGLMGNLLLPPIHEGARFALSVELSGAYFNGYTHLETELFTPIRRAIEASTYTTGLIRLYNIGGIYNPYVVIEGQSGREYGSATHLQDAVLSVVQSVYPDLDFGSVRFEADTYNPTTGGGQVVRYDAPTGGSAGNAPQPVTTGGATADIFSSFGNLLGVDRKTAFALGIGGALLGVLFISKLAR